MLLVFALWCFRAAAAPTADVSLYDTDTAAFQNEFQGLPRRTPSGPSGPHSGGGRLAGVRDPLHPAGGLSAVEAEALEKQDTGLWVLNPAPMFTLCGGDVGAVSAFRPWRHC